MTRNIGLRATALVLLVIWGLLAQGQAYFYYPISQYDPQDPHWVIDPILSDEFNYTGIPDQTKWRWDQFGSECGFHNAYCYTRETDTAQRFVRNGRLYLKILDTDYSTASCNCTDGFGTNHTVNFSAPHLWGQHEATYGHYELRLHVPNKQQQFHGIALAFWLYPLAIPANNYRSPFAGTDWTWQEIDILEMQMAWNPTGYGFNFGNRNPDTYRFFPRNATLAVRSAHLQKRFYDKWGLDEWAKPSLGKDPDEWRIVHFSNRRQDANYYNTFAVDWYPSMLNYYYNDEHLRQLNNQNINSSTYTVEDFGALAKSMIINLRIGDKTIPQGNTQFNTEVDVPFNTAEPFIAEIDYVRRYILRSNCGEEFAGSNLTFLGDYLATVKSTVRIENSTLPIGYTQYIRASEKVTLSNNFVVPLGAGLKVIPTPCY